VNAGILDEIHADVNVRRTAIRAAVVPVPT
jgi:hypothetical protein